MKEKRKWLRIEVGYSAWSPTSMEPPTNHKDAFVAAFSKPHPAWDKPGETEIDVPLDHDSETWVHLVLQKELDAALSRKEPIKVSEENRCYVLPQSKWASVSELQNSQWSGRPGTTCRLVGEKWHDSLTFLLLNGSGKPWGKVNLPGEALDTKPVPTDHFATATLVWECEKQSTKASPKSAQRKARGKKSKAKAARTPSRAKP